MINKARPYDPSATARQEKQLRRRLIFSSLAMLLVVFALDLPNPKRPLEAWRWVVAIAFWLLWVIADSIIKSRSVDYKGWLSVVRLILDRALPLAVLFASLYVPQSRMTVYLLLFGACAVFAFLEWGKL